MIPPPRKKPFFKYTFLYDNKPLKGTFQASASEGAILTMPDGAISQDLENLPRFREYVAANVERWYRYIHGPRGREAKNGDVRLVVGCDKATSLGIATLTGMTQHS
jgi:hypothetical protein